VQMPLTYGWPFVSLKSYVTKPSGIDTDYVNRHTFRYIGHDAIARRKTH
jgi:hypothetical protein